jgi:hypothetical protein
VSQYIINYIRNDFDNRNDIGDALEDQRVVDFTKVRPSLQFLQKQDMILRYKEDQDNENIFKAQVCMFIKRQAMYETNKRKAFALIYEQCHKTLQPKLKAREKYATEIKGDPIAMVKAIQEHSLSYQENC